VAKATLLRRRKWTDEYGNLYEIVAWQVERNVRQPDGVRYRLALIPPGEKAPAVLYDNHHPKGHHRHIGDQQEPYLFTTVRQLVADFLSDAREFVEDQK
jgi:hypothetical protein